MSEHEHGHDHDQESEAITVTLTLDNDEEVECAVLTIYDAGDYSYIALLPLDKDGKNEDGEVYIYRYSEDVPGEPVLENIETDEEYENAADVFDEWLDTQSLEDDE